MSDPPPDEQSPVAAARSAGDDPGGSVSSDIESRTIYYCCGLEGHSTDYQEKDMGLFTPFEALTVERTPENKQLLRNNRHKMAPLAERPPIAFESEWVYTNKKQQIEWTIEHVTDKEGFKNALETEGAIVMYVGHARYGRGPCFGPPGHEPGEDWEKGEDPNLTGIFRMGFKYVATPVHEIEDHGYTPNPATAEDLPLSGDDCDPDLVPFLGSVKEVVNSSLAKPLSKLDPEAKLLVYGGYQSGKGEAHVIHRAGWKETIMQEFGMELAMTEMKCAFFGHFGCSSFRHNYPILRKKFGWEKTDNQLALWTTASSWTQGAFFFLYHLLTVDKVLANKANKEWFDDVRTRTNRDLAASGCGFSLT